MPLKCAKEADRCDARANIALAFSIERLGHGLGQPVSRSALPCPEGWTPLWRDPRDGSAFTWQTLNAPGVKGKVYRAMELIGIRNGVGGHSL